MPNELPYLPLMPRTKKKDPTWLYPHATREQIENLRVYFEMHLPNRIRNWNGGIDTHALSAIARKQAAGQPWASVPPHFRTRVEAWFQMMLAKTKRERGFVSPGKVRSLRMNAACFGRYILTGKRRSNKAEYDRNKRKWLQFKEWEAQQQRSAFVASRGPMPNRRLEIG